MVAERHDEMADFIQRMGEQPVELSVEGRNMLSVAEKKALGSRRVFWRVTTSVEHQGETKGNEQQVAYAREYFVKAEAELPEIHDGILTLMDEPVVLQRQAPMIQKVLKTVEVPQVQYIGKIGDVPVVRQGQVPTFRTLQRTVEVPQVQFPDRVVGVPVAFQRQVPQEQILERIVEKNGRFPFHATWRKLSQL